MRRGVSSIPSESKACISSMNSPAVAAVANLAGMEGIEPLKGESWGRGGKVGGSAADT